MKTLGRFFTLLVTTVPLNTPCPYLYHHLIFGITFGLLGYFQYDYTMRSSFLFALMPQTSFVPQPRQKYSARAFYFSILTICIIAALSFLVNTTRHFTPAKTTLQWIGHPGNAEPFRSVDLALAKRDMEVRYLQGENLNLMGEMPN